MVAVKSPGDRTEAVAHIRSLQAELPDPFFRGDLIPKADKRMHGRGPWSKAPEWAVEDGVLVQRGINEFGFVEKIADSPAALSLVEESVGEDDEDEIRSELGDAVRDATLCKEIWESDPADTESQVELRNAEELVNELLVKLGQELIPLTEFSEASDEGEGGDAAEEDLGVNDSSIMLAVIELDPDEVLESLEKDLASSREYLDACVECYDLDPTDTELAELNAAEQEHNRILKQLGRDPIPLTRKREVIVPEHEKKERRRRLPTRAPPAKRSVSTSRARAEKKASVKKPMVSAQKTTSRRQRTAARCDAVCQAYAVFAQTLLWEERQDLSRVVFERKFLHFLDTQGCLKDEDLAIRLRDFCLDVLMLQSMTMEVFSSIIKDILKRDNS